MELQGDLPGNMKFQLRVFRANARMIEAETLTQSGIGSCETTSEQTLQLHHRRVDQLLARMGFHVLTPSEALARACLPHSPASTQADTNMRSIHIGLDMLGVR